MENLRIVVMGILLALNYVFGATHALILAIGIFLVPYVALNGDAGGNMTMGGATVVASYFALVATGAAWFLCTVNIKNDEAKGYFLPAFWPIPVLVLFFTFRMAS